MLFGASDSYEGDKVMQVVNDHERGVYNGDLGLVRRIDAEEGELAVDFEGREVAYGFGELDELVLAYATTVHKSQGSEYPEPPRVCRRLVSLSQAASATSCWAA